MTDSLNKEQNVPTAAAVKTGQQNHFLCFFEKTPTALGGQMEIFSHSSLHFYIFL